MQTKTQNKGLEVIDGRTQLIVPHKGRELTFIYQSKQKGSFINVRNALENQNLSMPTASQITSLVYSAFQEDNKCSKEIIKLMKSNWLWGNSGILWTPKGVYIQDEPSIVNERVKMSEGELKNNIEKKIVRFVPYGFKIGKQSTLELSKNGFIRALVGEQGAYKLAEIADKHKRKPYLHGFEKVGNPIQGVASLDSIWFVNALGVYGDRGLGKNGCAFGVLKETSKAGLQKN